MIVFQRTIDPVIHRLERALETGASREEVAEALALAEQANAQSGAEANAVLSPLLKFRATEYVQAERMLERRRLLFVVASVVCLFAAVVGGFGLATLDRMRSLVDHQTEFDRLVQAEQWDQASVYLDALDPQTRQESAFKRGRELVDQAIEREAEREVEFKRLAGELRRESNDLDPQQVEQLTRLARSDDERQIAAEMTAKLDEQQLRREAARANDQTHQFETLQKKVDQFLDLESSILDDQERDARRFELQQELGRFVTDHQFGNPELSAAAKQSAKMLAATGKRAKRRNDREKSIDKITESIGDAERFVAELERFKQQWPDDTLSRLLDRQPPATSKINATLAWIAALDHVGFRQPRLADSSVARDWLAVAGKAETLDADHPFAKQALIWKAGYQCIAGCDDVIKSLRDEFRSEILQKIYVYPDPNGQVFYSDQPPTNDSDRAHLVSIFSGTSLQRDTKNFGLRFRESVVPKVRLAGHSQFAAKMAQSVASVTVPDFTPVAYRLINELRTFEGDPEIHPIYQLVLMRRLLRIAVQGSVPIRDAFGDWLESLEASEFAWEANWMQPNQDDPDLVQHGTQAKRLLTVDDWDQRVETMLDSFKAFRVERPPAPRWVGWVSQGESQYQARLAEAPDSEVPDSEVLYVLAEDAQSGRTRVVHIGFASGTEPLAVTDPDAQQSGAMVCIVPDMASSAP